MKSKLLKEIIVVSLLSASSAFADVYVGVDYGQVSNTDKATASGTTTQDNKYSDLGIKLGTGTDGDWKLQLRVSRITFDKVIFDTTHKKLTELGFDALKEFEMTKDVYPYVKVGFGYGWMPVTGYTDSSIKEVSLNGGIGLSYKAVDHLYLVAGVDYIYRKWQDVTIGATAYKYTGYGTKIYAGVNYAF